MTTRNADEVDPEDFLRALLAVTPEDAAEVRAEADEKARPSAAADRQAAKSDDS